MRKMTVTIWEVLADGIGPGPAGDGTHVYRFSGKRGAEDAEAFARKSTCWGRLAEVNEVEVPRDLARRWGHA